MIYDSDGIPSVNYGKVKGIEIGLQRYPITSANKAMSFLLAFENTGNETFKEKFLNNVNWLMENATSKGNYSIYEHVFPWPPYNLSIGWHSALAQSLALETMIKAYELTTDIKYLQTAKKLLNALYVDVKDGGVTYKNNSGWWYEEYTDNKTVVGPKVLNGMMFTLRGIYNYYNYTGDPDARYLFDRGVTGLKKDFHIFDHNQTYSAYDRFGGYAPYGYHLAHVELLKILYNITKEPFFRVYGDSWGKFVLPNMQEEEKSIQKNFEAYN